MDHDTAAEWAWSGLLVGALTLALAVLWHALRPPRFGRRGAGEDGVRGAACGACGYAARELTSLRCPECGGEFAVVGLRTARLAARASATTFTVGVAWTVVMLFVLTVGRLAVWTPLADRVWPETTSVDETVWLTAANAQGQERGGGVIVNGVFSRTPGEAEGYSVRVQRVVETGPARGHHGTLRVSVHVPGVERVTLTARVREGELEAGSVRVSGPDGPTPGAEQRVDAAGIAALVTLAGIQLDPALLERESRVVADVVRLSLRPEGVPNPIPAPGFVSGRARTLSVEETPVWLVALPPALLWALGLAWALRRRRRLWATVAEGEEKGGGAGAAGATGATGATGAAGAEHAGGGSGG